MHRPSTTLDILDESTVCDRVMHDDSDHASARHEHPPKPGICICRQGAFGVPIWATLGRDRMASSRGRREIDLVVGGLSRGDSYRATADCGMPGS